MRISLLILKARLELVSASSTRSPSSKILSTEYSTPFESVYDMVYVEMRDVKGMRIETLFLSSCLKRHDCGIGPSYHQDEHVTSYTTALKE